MAAAGEQKDAQAAGQNLSTGRLKLHFPGN